MAKTKKRGKIIIDRERCKGCGLCISVCPEEVIEASALLNHMGYSPAELHEDKKQDKVCIACATCATICPDIAIEVYRD